jgi:hypothetical protein
MQPMDEEQLNFFTSLHFGQRLVMAKKSRSRLTQNQRSHLVKINSGQVRSVSKYLHMSSFKYFITSSSLLLFDVD